MFIYADRSLVPSAADGALVGLLALGLVMSVALTVVAAHRFRYIRSCSEFTKRTQINFFWYWSREGAKNSSGGVAFLILQSFSRCDMSKPRQVRFRDGVR